MYIFKTLLVQTIWGGDAIAALKGLETDMTSVGESWEISAIKGTQSVVADGKDEGKTITELIEEQKEKLVGKGIYARYGNTFPLLIKFIDARSDLSIQVHPDDDVALTRHGSRGKTEMWYIVNAEDYSYIRMGFNQPVKKEDYSCMVENHTFADVLNKVMVSQGDVYYLPAGRVHCLGPGTVVAEIQETSDITYRIYDYGRKDANGNERELHTELAKDVIDYSALTEFQTPYEKVKDKRAELVDCKHFTTNLLDMTKTYHADYKDLDSFVVLMCMEGGATVKEMGPDGEQTRAIKQGTTVLLPATTQEVEIAPEGNCKMLEVYIKA